MRAVVACLLLGLAVANAASFREEEYQTMFSKFMGQYGKKYTSDNFFFRYTVFKANTDKIALANKQNHTYRLGMNEMGDMTHAEFKLTKLGYNHVERTHLRAQNACPKGNTPASIDWVAKGGVTPIKNQGQCGSCWSFSSTGAIEGAVFAHAHHLISLSEQQLVDCSTAQGNEGCNGGLMDNAFEYVISNKGITTEASYPYTATGPNTCQSGHNAASKITGYCDVTPNDEAALAAAVAVNPVAVAIEADQSCFQFYSGGVMSDKSCGTQLDHGVLAVGYGVSGGHKYWNVKNSWGTSWGLNGYIMLGKEVSGQSHGVCGIAMQPSYPLGATVA
jgi:cathepsin L